jgi:hypothetical protein
MQATVTQAVKLLKPYNTLLGLPTLHPTMPCQIVTSDNVVWTAIAGSQLPVLDTEADLTALRFGWQTLLVI